jgi:hypothetical protein
LTNSVEKVEFSAGLNLGTTTIGAIAKQCGSDEIAETRARIEALKTESASVEKWDGDTQDEINIAIFRFSQLLKLASI